MNGRPSDHQTKKLEHEFVKNVIKYGKREVFKKMMKRFFFKQYFFIFELILRFNPPSNMKLKLHDLIYLACLYGQIEIVKDMIDHQGSDFEVSKKSV